MSGVHCVYYRLRRGGQVVARADYCGEGRKGWAAAGLASITVYAVPSPERRATEACLMSEVLPRLVDWLRGLESAGNARRGVDQRFVASMKGDSAVVSMS